jgi:hypothetical protein
LLTAEAAMNSRSAAARCCLQLAHGHEELQRGQVDAAGEAAFGGFQASLQAMALPDYPSQ